LKRKQWIVGLVVLAALAAFLSWGRSRIHFDFSLFAQQVKLANWRLIALAVACIYSSFGFRSARWALLQRHNKKVGLFALLGTQVIGFTAVALIGRVADPVRPYLVSRKTGIPLSTQLGIYVVERLFDFGTMALIISLVILAAPAGSMPHLATVKKAGFGGLAITVCAGLFLLALRLYGGFVASLMEKLFGIVSKPLGQAVGNKMRAFRSGLDTMRSFSDFAIAFGISLVMWVLITLAYVEIMRAFTADPVLAGINIPQCVAMLAVSGGASVLQLPVVGWFSQIALVAAALVNFFGAGTEASTACAAMLLLGTFLSIVPIGLIWAQFEHVSLRKLTKESEHAGDELAAQEPLASPNE
jgi:glycosyltransferase 2 family protein